MTRHSNIPSLRISLALVLACLVTWMLATPASAAIITPDLDASCSLTLTLKTNDGAVAPGLTMGVIRVADPVVTDTGYEYQLTSDFAATGVDLSSIGIAESDQANAAALVGYAEAHGHGYTTAVTDASGVASFSDLQSGLYVVTVTDAPEGYTLSSPFLVSLPQGDFEDGWTYDVVADEKPLDLTYKAPAPTPTPDKRIPQTGQFWLPVFLLAFAGLLLFGTGWYRWCRSGAQREAF